MFMAVAVAQVQSNDFCWKRNYGRGLGVIPRSCPPGKEKAGLLCREPCKPGYTGAGYLCWKDCPKGYQNDGLTCRRPKPLHVKGRESYGRGFGSARICGEGYEMQGGFCYKKCKESYVGTGPMCFKECSGQLSHNCGATCAVNHDACIDGIYRMGASSIKLVANIGLLAATAGASSEIAVGAGTAGVATEVAAAGSPRLVTAGAFASLAAMIPEGERETITEETAEKLKSQFGNLTTVVAKEIANQVVVNGINGRPMDWTKLERMDPIGAIAVVKAFKRPFCSPQ